MTKKRPVSADTLTDKQASLAALLADPREDRSDMALAAVLAVSPSTIARWRRLPAVVERARELVRAQTDERMPKVWEGILARAEEGDVAAARLLFQVRGEMKDKKDEAITPPPPEVKISFPEARNQRQKK